MNIALDTPHPGRPGKAETMVLYIGCRVDHSLSWSLYSFASTAELSQSVSSQPPLSLNPVWGNMKPCSGSGQAFLLVLNLTSCKRAYFTSNDVRLPPKHDMKSGRPMGLEMQRELATSRQTRQSDGNHGRGGGRGGTTSHVPYRTNVANFFDLRRTPCYVDVAVVKDAWVSWATEGAANGHKRDEGVKGASLARNGQWPRRHRSRRVPLARSPFATLGVVVSRIRNFRYFGQRPSYV